MKEILRTGSCEPVESQQTKNRARLLATAQCKLAFTALSIEISAGELKLGVIPKTSLFHINDFNHYDLMPYAYATEWGPAKVLPIGPRTC